MAPKTLFYRLAELSERWDRPVDDLLQWGVAGELTIFVFLEDVLAAPNNLKLWEDTNTAKRILRAYGKVLKDDIENLCHSKSETIDLFCFYIYQDEGPSASVKWNETFKTLEPEFITFSRDDLLVATSEASRIEVKHPDLLKQPASLAKDSRSKQRVNKRSEKGDLVTIGALIAVLKEKTSFTSQEKIIEDRFKKVRPLSSRTLNTRFSDANKALETAVEDFKESISD